MPHQCTNCERTFSDGSKEMLSGCPDCGGTKFQFRPGGFGSDDEGASAGASASSGTGSATAAAVETAAESASEPPEPPDRPGDTVTRTVGSAAATVREFVSGKSSAGAPDGGATDETNAKPPTGTTTPTQTADGDGDDDIIVAESEPIETGEDTAQADARTQIVEPDDVPDSDGFDPATGGESESPEEVTDGNGIDDDSQSTEIEDVADDDSVADETAVATDETTTADRKEEAVESDGDRTVAERPDAERADRPDLSELRAELNEQFESIRVVEPGQYELNLMELYDREEYIIALQEDGRYSIQVPDSWREADA